MEAEEMMNVGIGDKEREIKSLDPKEVEITAVEIQTKTKEGQDMTPKVNIKIKHPDKDEMIVLDEAKFLVNEKATVKTLWLTFDEDQKIDKGSYVAKMLSFLGVNTLSDLKGKKCNTVYKSDSNKYLAFKCY